MGALKINQERGAVKAVTTVRIKYTSWDDVHVDIPAGTLLVIFPDSEVAVYNGRAFAIRKSQYQVDC